MARDRDRGGEGGAAKRHLLFEDANEVGMGDRTLGDDESLEAAESDDTVLRAEMESPPTEQVIVGAEPASYVEDAALERQRDEHDRIVEINRRIDEGPIPRLLVIALGMAALAFAVMFLQELAGVIGPVFLALNFMIAAHPLHIWLVNHRVHRFIAATLTGTLVLLLLGAFFYSIVWSVTQLVVSLPDYSAQFNDLYQSALHQLNRAGVTESGILDQLRSISPSNVLNYVRPIVSNLGGIASLLLVLVTVVFFLTMDSVTFNDRLDLAQRYHPRFIGALRSFAVGVRRYWIVSSVFGLIVAVLDVLALWIIGVPLALVWGILSFLTNYIPNVGFVIGLVPPALLALLALGPAAAIAVVVTYSVLNFIIQSIVMPRYTGQAVGITPTLTFFSLLFWAWALGVMGALLAVPLTLLAKALLVDADPKARWANALIASDPQTCIVEDDVAKPIMKRPLPRLRPPVL